MNLCLVSDVYVYFYVDVYMPVVSCNEADAMEADMCCEM